jgi:hypothetical protein
MHDVETQTFAIGQQRLGEEEIEYGPDVPLATRLRLAQASLHS